MTDKPASRLNGATLVDGWRVVEAVPHPADVEGATGGNFSYGYVAEKSDGTRGFVKALDFTRATIISKATGQPFADVMAQLVNAYIFERDLVLLAGHRRLSKVVAGLAHGEIVLDEADPLGTVQYIVFEQADGDIRRYMADSSFDAAWSFRALHHIALGLHQLHRLELAHQDVKPSNVLVFENSTAKLTDFGCADRKGTHSPRGALRIAGDPQYAPPELCYGHVPADWSNRRVGCDFLFGDTSMNGLLYDQLPDEYHPRRWMGRFDEVLPFLKNAFSSALDLFAADVPMPYRDELVGLVAQLCNPEPETRGWHRSLRRGRRGHSVEPFVGRFDLLASKAERGLFPRNR